MSAAKAVIFDLDDTLLDRSASFRFYVPRFAKRFAEYLEPVEMAELRRVILEADGGGYRPREEMAIYLRDHLTWRSTPPLKAMIEAYREDFLASACPAEGMVETIEAIRRAGLKTGIITNGIGVVQRRKIAKLGLDHLIDVIVVSEETGFKKPAREIYEIALKGLGTKPAETWFIGDHPEFDVMAPMEMGMKGIWIRRMQPWPAGRERCGVEIGELRDALRILKL